MRSCGQRINAILCMTAVVVLLFVTPALADQAKKGPLKVFILAGQSNMEGQGKIACDLTKNGGKGSLEYLVHHPATASRFKRVAGQGRQVDRP